MQSNLWYFILACLALSAITSSSDAGDKDAKPDSDPLSRYQAMIDRSPFALATESAPPSPAPENLGFTKDLVLTGAVRLNEGAYLTIESKDHTQRFSLWNRETYNEISLVSVTWSDAVGKTKATLKKGTEFGTIGFDEAAMKATNVPPPKAPHNGHPPVNAPGDSQPPRPPGMVGQPHASVKSPQQNSVIIRRVRPIPSSPVR